MLNWEKKSEEIFDGLILYERTMLDVRVLESRLENNQYSLDDMIYAIKDALRPNLPEEPKWYELKNRKKYKELSEKISVRTLNKTLTPNQIQVLFMKLRILEGLQIDTCKECGGPIQKKSSEMQ